MYNAVAILIRNDQLPWAAQSRSRLACTHSKRKPVLAPLRKIRHLHTNIKGFCSNLTQKKAFHDVEIASSFISKFCHCVIFCDEPSDLDDLHASSAFPEWKTLDSVHMKKTCHKSCAHHARYQSVVGGGGRAVRPTKHEECLWLSALGVGSTVFIQRLARNAKP